MTPDLLAAIREHKPELLVLLSLEGNHREEFLERAAIMEFDGGLERRKSERLALELEKGDR